MESKFRHVIDELIDYALSTSDPDVLRYMVKRAQEGLKTSTAIVKHAGGISEAKRMEIIRAVKTKFPEVHDVLLEEDNSLIGGVEILFKDYRYDGSIKGKFDELMASLISD